MDVINIEIYSLVILGILLFDYTAKFKKQFTVASQLWLTITISAIVVSISNIFFALSTLYAFKLIFLIIYLLGTLNCSLFVYIYIKHNYIKKQINLKNEFFGLAASFLFCIFIAIVYLLIFNSGYIIHSFNRSFINKLLILAIIPNVSMGITYLAIEAKKRKQLNYKIVCTLLFAIFGLLLDILYESLFFVSASFTIASLILYINKHEVLLNTDPLTGLFNKRALYSFVEHLRPNLNIAVYNIDIDRFKLINDTYGHYKGDLVLKDVATILRNSSRERDLVIRNGGDEFLVMAILRKSEDVPALAQRIKENVNEYNKNNAIPISLSVGWGIYESSSLTSTEEFNTFLKMIDKRMYLRKARAHKKDNH